MKFDETVGLWWGWRDDSGWNVEEDFGILMELLGS
jgi:hypothetical protein